MPPAAMLDPRVLPPGFDPRQAPPGTLVWAAGVAAPLPPPQLLAEYEKILPGISERLMARFEEQSQHRQQIEATVVNADVRFRHRGQTFALAVAVLGLLVALALGLAGRTWTAAVIAAVDLVSLVAVFLATRNTPARPPSAGAPT